VSPTIDFARAPEDGHEKKRNQEMKNWCTQKTTPAEELGYVTPAACIGLGVERLK
jgi:hypothetical protein